MGNYGGNFGNMMGGWPTNGVWFSIFSFLGPILMLVFWALIIVGAIVLIRWLINQSKNETSGKMPLEILKERYAKGEISREEFEKIKKDLA